MFNPFVKFVPQLIDAFRKHNERYIVSQTFKGGFDLLTNNKEVFMFSKYADLKMAEVHVQALINDKYAAIIDLEKDKHRNKIMEMLQPDSRYLVFSNLVKDQHAIEVFANKHYASKLRRYIEKNTTWRIAKSSNIQPKLQLIFGELFIVLKFGSEQMRVKLQDIEKS